MYNGKKNVATLCPFTKQCMTFHKTRMRHNLFDLLKHIYDDLTFSQLFSSALLKFGDNLT